MKLRRLLVTAVFIFAMGGVVSGCGSEKEEQDSGTVITGVMSEKIPVDDIQSKEENPKDKKEEDQTGVDGATVSEEKNLTDTDKTQTNDEKSVNSSETGNNAEPASEDLFGDVEGHVESLTDDGFVINQAIVSEDTATITLSKEDKTLVTVHCTDATIYQILEIRNGGVNGSSDVTKTDATSKDIVKGSSVTLTGKWEGSEFYAEKVGLIKIK